MEKMIFLSDCTRPLLAAMLANLKKRAAEAPAMGNQMSTRAATTTKESTQLNVSSKSFTNEGKRIRIRIDR